MGCFYTFKPTLIVRVKLVFRGVYTGLGERKDFKTYIINALTEAFLHFYHIRACNSINSI